MKAVRCCDKQVHVVDVPAPNGEGVIVTMRSAGICGSDLHMVKAGFDLPSTLGHEVAGIMITHRLPLDAAAEAFAIAANRKAGAIKVVLQP